jgi:hypothetical protein
MAEALGFAEQLGYPSESKIFEGGPNDYLYCSPDNQETEVCCFMADTLDDMNCKTFYCFVLLE